MQLDWRRKIHYRFQLHAYRLTVLHVQGQAADLKAELRELLSSHGITSFVVKPVKRSYAFEDPNIPHGQQWVLKVRCPGTAPTLPLGTAGVPKLRYDRLCGSITAGSGGLVRFGDSAWTQALQGSRS